MIQCKRVTDLQRLLGNERKKGLRIGFVPTMGALHEGHISLINRCRQENDIAVCSIFVNPAQFNNKEDFIKYPISTGPDIDLLLRAACDYAFLPAAADIYPAGLTDKVYQLGQLETILEGEFRPGHFQGVCKAVDRLLHIVRPDTLYLGRKDLQQCMVVKAMMAEQGHEAKLAFGETVREANGLAMSSRNRRLTETQREKAGLIYKHLEMLKNVSNDFELLQQQLTSSRRSLDAAGFKVEYLAAVDGQTLLPANEKSDSVIAVIAAWLHDVRLIDNMTLRA